MKSVGTPKTLGQAIRYGIVEASHTVLGKCGSLSPEWNLARMQCEFSEIIEKHVLDYLRQRFGVLYLEMDGIRDSRALERVRAVARLIGVEK